MIDVSQISAMSGQEFENLVAVLLKSMGFQVQSTKASRDGGIDLIVHCDVPLHQGKYIVQCKRYDSSVGEPCVRDLFGVMIAEHANKGILVTNSVFTSSAHAFASGKPLELIDGNRLLQLLAEQQILGIEGVKVSIENDEDVTRLRQLICAMPDHLPWRIQLAQHILGIINTPRGISSKEQLMPFVEEAEIQLSAIHELSSQRSEKAYRLIEHSCALWIGRLQLAQRKVVAAVTWMAEIRTGAYSDGSPIESPTNPEFIDRFYMANAINIANVAFACGKKNIRSMIFSRYRERIDRFVKNRTQSCLDFLKLRGEDSETVHSMLSQIERLRKLNDDCDVFFYSPNIVSNLNDLLDRPNDFPYEEVMAQLSRWGSISQFWWPSSLFTLNDESLVNQGDQVERVIEQRLRELEPLEAQGGGWQAKRSLRVNDRVRIMSWSPKLVPVGCINFRFRKDRKSDEEAI
jgi:hypothetical protein